MEIEIEIEFLHNLWAMHMNSTCEHFCTKEKKNIEVKERKKNTKANMPQYSKDSILNIDQLCLIWV